MNQIRQNPIRPTSSFLTGHASTFLLRAKPFWANRETLTRNTERGMVTAELAVGLLAACLIFLGFSWGASLIGTQIRCSDTAAAIARQISRNDLKGAEIASQNAPAGASISVTETERQVIVEVNVERAFAGFGTTISGSSRMLKEHSGIDS